MTVQSWNLVDSEKYPDLADACTICRNTQQDLVLAHHNKPDERIQHVFHRNCLRGYVLETNDQKCPYCRETIEVGKLFAHSSLKRINDSALARIGFGIMTSVVAMGSACAFLEDSQVLPFALSIISVPIIMAFQYLKITKTIPGAMTLALSIIGMGIIGAKLLARNFDDSLIADPSNPLKLNHTEATLSGLMALGLLVTIAVDYLSDLAIQKIVLS